MLQSPTGFTRRYSTVLLLGLILLFYFINGVFYLQQQSLTSDEGSFMTYAIRYVKGDPERIYPRTDNSKMPVSALNLLPRIIEKVLTGVEEKQDGGLSDTMNGRYVTLFISLFTIILVFQWAKELYGNRAGLFAAFLMSFCPNNLANAALVTTDSYSVLFLLLTMYLLWKYARKGGTRLFIALSIVVGLSQLVKQSLFHLYILVPACLLVYYSTTSTPLKWKTCITRIIQFILVNIVIINIAYFLNGSFVSLSKYNFMSELFSGLQRSLPGWLPLPFPKPFVEGLDMAKYYDQVGGGIAHVSSFGKPTILGEARTGGGFWYYYFVSIFYKTPIPFLLLFIWTCILMFRNWSLKKFVSNQFFLLAPVVYFLITMSFFYKTQCGIRHIIFIYPFMFIFAAGIIPYISKTYEKILLGALCLYLVISVLFYWRNYYPYTNEFIYDKKNAYLKVGASNLEFQQGYFFAKEYMEQHPGVTFAPKEAATGVFIIRTDEYLDIWNTKEYAWISDLKPIGHVAYSYLLINVTEADLKLTNK
jgi:hypothetical protein